MNYLAHAKPLLDAGAADPYEIAGVATPDWLGVAARRVKCRSKHAAPFRDADDSALASVARGVMRHHADDLWFHESRAFTELSLDFAKQLRGALGEATAMRPWFVGHILVEMLLDAELDRRQLGLLDRYYEAVSSVDGDCVRIAIERMTGQLAPRLPEFIEKFVAIRFLEDYREESGLLMRLNQVMGRVGLSELPASVLPVLARFRGQVASRASELLSPTAAAA